MSLLAGWALIEGGLILMVPRVMLKITGKLFPKAAKAFGDLGPAQFRLYGAIEAAFGALLGLYLLWAT